MKKYHEIQNLYFDKDKLKCIIDGKKYSFLLADISQRLETASQIERERFEISPSGYGIHWSLIDEDLSIDGLLGIRHKPSFSKQAELT